MTEDQINKMKELKEKILLVKKLEEEIESEFESVFGEAGKLDKETCEQALGLLKGSGISGLKFLLVQRLDKIENPLA